MPQAEWSENLAYLDKALAKITLATRPRSLGRPKVRRLWEGKSRKSPGGIMGDSAYYNIIYIYMSCCIDKGKCLSESCKI